MTGNLATDFLIVFIPGALAIIMGILGALRGARREAVVSFSIVLAALIILVWGTPWASDLTGMFANLQSGDTRNALAYVVLALSVLVIGYMLGSAIVPRTPISAMSRVGGFLLGVANGLAIGGYLIRIQYESALLNPGANVDLIDTLTTNIVARGLWIWANWFPLAIAIIAAIVALVAPFRRAQTIVATPSASTDWGPSAAPAVGATMAAPGPAAYTTGYGQGFTSQYPQQQAPQYGPQFPQAPAQPQPYVASGQAYSPYPQFGQQPAPSNPQPASQQPYTPVPSTQGRLEDAPPTVAMPSSDTTRPTPPGGQETLYIGTTPPNNAAAQSKPPEWSGYNEPSWLTSTQPASSNASGASASSSPQLDSSLVARSEAPTQAQPVVTPPPAKSGSGPSTGPLSDNDSDTKSFVHCPRCGTQVPADATFCTECGNRLKA
jgi:hypothetical protein